MRMRSWMMMAAIVATPAAVVAKVTISPAIMTALADPARADQAKDDERRHAAEVIAFSGVKPGWQVVDFFPGSGYWSRIFAGVVGPSGHVYGIWPSIAAKYAEKGVPGLQARNLANLSASLDAQAITVPQPVDLVWTVQNYHDIPNDGRGEAGIAAFNAQAFKALKPGGTFIVIDHVAPTGSGLADTDTLHRIDPTIVKKQVLAAGFQWVGESKALANPKDDHSLKVFDPAIRGFTDQFVYKFRKPLK